MASSAIPASASHFGDWHVGARPITGRDAGKDGLRAACVAAASASDRHRENCRSPGLVQVRQACQQGPGGIEITLCRGDIARGEFIRGDACQRLRLSG